MKAKIVLACAVLLGCLALVVPARRAGSTPQASDLFSVVGGDYMSPLIGSPRALQRLNAELGGSGRFAGYDQLTVLVSSHTAPHLVNVTRYCGDLLSMLAVEYLEDGRARVEGHRVFVSETYWRSVLEAASDIVGTAVELGGETYRIAGIVRANSVLPLESDFWVPICSRTSYGTMTSMRVVGTLLAGKDWRDSEKLLRKLIHTNPLSEQLVELDAVRFLPVDRKLVLDSPALERFAQRFSWRARSKPAA